MNNWISVNDRLPDKDGKYLVTIHFCNRLFIDVVSFTNKLSEVSFEFEYAAINCDRAGWYDYASDYGYYEKLNIIAWQPLPEPYKEADNEVDN